VAFVIILIMLIIVSPTTTTIPLAAEAATTTTTTTTHLVPAFPWKYIMTLSPGLRNNSSKKRSLSLDSIA